MSTRAALSRARERERVLAGLPQARDVLRPEVLAGSSGTPLEWARRFHQSFFDVTDNALDDRCLLVLPDVVIGRAGPLLREVQLWAATHESEDLIRRSPADVARQFSSAPGMTPGICTAAALFLPSFESSPYLDDVDLRCSMSASLCLSTTVMLAGVAPYVRVGDAVVRGLPPVEHVASPHPRRPRRLGILVGRGSADRHERHRRHIRLEEVEDDSCGLIRALERQHV